MELNYKRLGAGAPVIILHGLFGMLDNWLSLGKKLSDSYEVILIDQRNHGRSFHSSEINYLLLAEDLKIFIEQHQLQEISIIGHSMGGKVAMQFAQNYVHALDKIIVVDIAPKTNPPIHLSIFDALLSLDLSQYTTRNEVNEDLAEAISNNAIRQFLLKNLARDDANQFYWKANFESLFANYPSILDNIDLRDEPVDVPILFVAGTKSPYVTDADIPLIKKAFRHHQMVKINAGHWIHTEKPVELEETIRHFLHQS